MSTIPLPPHILTIDKPAGITSFGVVARVRRVLGGVKVGHAGTLDPLATGLMVLGVGKGTKTLAELTKLDKEYVTEILLGRQSSTGDREGDVVAEREVVEAVAKETISAALATLVGELSLPVSGYSAIKVDGVPMYKRARAAAKAGTPIPEVASRAMRVDAAELLASNTITCDSKNFQLITVRFAVGSGTYIRSLGEELGRRLGYPASLHSLRRTKVGKWDVVDAPTLETFMANPPSNT